MGKRLIDDRRKKDYPVTVKVRLSRKQAAYLDELSDMHYGKRSQTAYHLIVCGIHDRWSLIGDDAKARIQKMED